VRILLVEDDESIAEVLKAALTSQHYLVELATDGEVGWQLAEAFEYDLILLDLMLPKLDGISFCRQRRAKGDRTPILLLTGQDTSTNKVMGLDAGADDYIVKPFDLHELLARIRAVLRRGGSTPTLVLEWENLCLNPSNCEVTYNGQLLHLTSKEYALLELFLRNTHRIFSQSALLDHLWSFEEPPSENAVRAHIKSLRQKLKKVGAAADLIETVYGLGYRLKPLKPRESSATESPEQTASLDERLELTTSGTYVGKVRGGDSAASVYAEFPSQETRSEGGLQTLPYSNGVNSALARSQSHPSSPSSPTATDTHPPQPKITPELINSIWERFKGKYSDRVTVLEQALAAAIDDSLSEGLRQQAKQEAHTLAGSLGSFGFAEASRLSREIEQTFQVARRLSQAQKEQLSLQVVALRQALQQPPVIATTIQQDESTESVVTPESATVKPPPRLLIVDDDAALGLVLRAEVTARGMQAEIATDLSQARDAIAHHRPDVVLLDLCFPDSAENGLELLAELTSAEPPVPVLVFTAQESFADRVKVARLGGRGFLQKPVDSTQICRAIAQVLEPASTPEAQLLIVDNDPQVLDSVRSLLEPWGFKLTLLDDPLQFWDTLEQSAPNVLILALDMPELSGIDLCQVVRNDPRWSELPVLLLSNHADAQIVHQVFTSGADDYIAKPIVGPELLARVLNRVERVQMQRKLRKFIN
jgi:DNA-binding response OmpR family regulator/HPt (histidine-containing phosphotransfer) domain-containing protein